MAINGDTLNMITALFTEMEGKTEDEVIEELAYMIKSGKGGLTIRKAKEIIKTVLPMIDSSKKPKLEKLLKALQ